MIDDEYIYFEDRQIPLLPTPSPRLDQMVKAELRKRSMEAQHIASPGGAPPPGPPPGHPMRHPYPHGPPGIHQRMHQGKNTNFGAIFWVIGFQLKIK